MPHSKRLGKRKQNCPDLSCSNPAKSDESSGRFHGRTARSAKSLGFFAFLGNTALVRYQELSY